MIVSSVTVSVAYNIDSWQIFYNLKKIGSFDENTEKLTKTGGRMTIHLVDSTISESDSISIHYWSDTPCEDCNSTLYVIAEHQTVAIRKTAIGNRTPLTFKVKELENFAKSNSITEFDLYYSDKGQIPRRKLCTIVFN